MKSELKQPWPHDCITIEADALETLLDEYRYSDFEANYEKALNSSPNENCRDYVLLLCLEKDLACGHFHEAQASAAHLIAKHPHNPRVTTATARLFLNIGRIQEAEALADSLLKSADVESKALGCLCKGLQSEEQHDFNSAFGWYLQGVRNHPKNRELVCRLAYTHAQHHTLVQHVVGAWEITKQALDDYLEYDPLDMAVRVRYAAVLYVHGADTEYHEQVKVVEYYAPDSKLLKELKAAI